ncbi:MULTISPECIES: DUF2799 domain-containing protein [Microbulbifer]|uniref:DUF2799 domain-containing protein n=1 Tax=Microbulbifer TaxID=48073 RepID=UPI001E46DD91|nr:MULTISPECIES: DUF2799 domain-containing protein [Microbulbifer]UHQ56840.1 DUF2799 domain-containing protein [Microbulbifer sp. YPW16]
MIRLKSLLIPAAALVPVLLSGCAVISEEQCRAGSWYELGVQDGSRGVGQAKVFEMAQECQHYGVRVDSEAWLRGHEEGVEEYCTAANGFSQGRRGRNYQGVCTGPTADLFLKEYERGLALYRVEQEYRQLVSRHEYLRDELYSVRAALRSAESEEQVQVLQMRRRSLRRELRMLDLELHRFGAPGVNFWY